MTNLETPVDLRSDTVTKPNEAMREAIARAEVGDDVYDEDPTVNLLQRKAADLLGKEAALLVPSGTMGNLLALLSLTAPGDTVLLADGSHVYRYEAGACARVAGLLTKTIPASSGILDSDSIEKNLVLTEDSHFSRTTLVSIENTMNSYGGAVYPLETVREISSLVRDRGLKLHCDGARIFNAAVATGRPASDYAAECDTVMFCLSKGLGCPVGSLLVADNETIRRAHRFRKMLGGGMRQAGVLAAAGLYALENNIDRLAEDHRRAARFRQAIRDLPGVAFPFQNPTNMVFVEVSDAPRFVKELEARGVLCFDVSPERLRFVFHLNVDDNDLDRAVEAFKDVVRKT